MENLFKKCSKCNKIKSVYEFYERKDGKGGYRSDCKKCYYKRIKHTTYKSFYNLLKKSPLHKINNLIATNLRHALKRNYKESKYEGILGYYLLDLRDHLIQTIPMGYTWNDYVDGKLEIDHIMPRRKFNYIKINDQQVKECWSLKNLRLLEAKENRKRNS